MANKPLKSVQFPGLDDTYTIPQVDTTLAVTGAAADSKKVGDEITELKNDLTDIETDISTGNLTAGTAEQLLSDNGMTDKSPYLFRAMPTGAGDREEPAVVGGSVVWNQLVQNGNFADGTTGWGEPTGYTMSVSDNIMTLTYVEANSSAALMGNALGTIEGHKYLVSAQVKFDKNPAQAPFLGSGGYQGVTKNITTGSWQEISGIFERATGGNDRISFYPRGTSGAGWVSGDKVQIKDIICADLTAMLPTAVVNYVYSLEQATAGAGLAYLRKYGFFTSDYYPYTEPTFKHVGGLVSHKMVGFNQWTNDKYETTTGAEIVKYGDDGLRVITYARQENTNKFPVVDTDSRFQISFDYKVTATSNANASFGVYFYYTDGTNNKNTCYMDAVGKTYHVSFISNNGKKVSHIAFGGWSYTGTADISNICLHLVLDGSRNGDYEPYTAHTYPLDPDVVLRGYPKLDASNNLYFDGDVYKADGTVTRRYDIMDLGTLTYNKYVNPTTGITLFYADIANGAEIVNIGRDALCDKYVRYVGKNNDWYTAMPDKCFVYAARGVSDTSRVWIRDDAYSDAATFKAAMSGTYLLYEKATPTEETADPYAPLQLADPYGTEEWVLDDEAFPMPVGQETFYPENLRAKIEGLPWNFANLIAPTETTNTATRNYTTGNLLIVNNILYKVTVNIANGGTITPGTNVTATTLAEIISALQ